ncbi:SUKH-4 family immunity protein [Streptomyces sp. KL116D]|uniref:SUKH-4 family immunity protein n=1 Tax=Streptomyces sp. KL116D TaxID=3045152 RepID=UPI0035564622
MLFDVSHEELLSSLSEKEIFLVGPGSLGAIPEDSLEGHILHSVGIPTGAFQGQHLTESGRFPRVDEKIELSIYDAPPPGCEAWVVFGYVAQTHLALDPSTGVVHAFSENGGAVQGLHSDLSSLVYLTFRLHTLLKEFVWSEDREDEEEDFERLEESLGEIRQTVEDRDPLPFSGTSVWPAILDDMAVGMWS